MDDALRNLCDVAALELWNEVNGKNFENEYDRAECTAKACLDQEIHMLNQMAAREIGAQYTTRPIEYFYGGNTSE